MTLFSNFDNFALMTSLRLFCCFLMRHSHVFNFCLIFFKLGNFFLQLTPLCEIATQHFRLLFSIQYGKKWLSWIYWQFNPTWNDNICKVTRCLFTLLTRFVTLKRDTYVWGKTRQERENKKLSNGRKSVISTPLIHLNF